MENHVYTASNALREWNPSDLSGKKVLAVFAHPDDCDFYFGGTIARLTAAGARVFYVCATRGDKGDDSGAQSAGAISQLRESEQRRAGEALGVFDIEFLGLPDGHLVYSHDLIAQIVEPIRRLQPDIVLALDTAMFDPIWGVNHADHRALAQATIDAVYPYARNPHEFIHLNLPAHTVTMLLSVNYERPNCFVDITGKAFEQKKLALSAHESQWGDSDGGVKAAEAAGLRETFVRVQWST